MQLFLLGALTMASTTASLLFLKFWVQTRERIFAMFSCSFLVLAIDWVVLAASLPQQPGSHAFYLRLLAFLLIIIGVVDKNRTSRSHVR